MTSTVPTSSTTASDAQRAAADAASTAKEQLSSIATTSRDDLKDVANTTKQHVGDAVAQTRDQLRSQAEEQFGQVAGTVRDIARQFTNMAQSQPGGGAGVEVVGDVGASLERFADRADQNGLDGALRDMKGFARRRPVAFLAASLGAGMLAGRVLRTSDTHALIESAKPDGSSGTASASATGSPTGIPAPARTAPLAPAPGALDAIDLTEGI